MRFLVLATILGLAVATHPCAVLRQEKSALESAEATFPSGAELIKEFISFHENFADKHDEFKQFVAHLYDLYDCSRSPGP
jgi:hypothetical protein